MNTTNPFVPPEEFLERRSARWVDNERRRQDARWGWEHDRKHDGRAWLFLIEKQIGQLGHTFLGGGRFGGFDRKAAIRDFIEIAALARRAAAVLAAEIFEAEGEHIDDGLGEMFDSDGRTGVADAGPLSREQDLLADAWGVIANVSGGDWSKQSPEWRGAAERFRDRFTHLPADVEVPF